MLGGRGEPGRGDGLGRAFRRDGGAGRVPGGASDDAAVAGAGAADTRSSATRSRRGSTVWGLFGKRSYEKFVPEAVFRAPNDQVALFLRHLWATDGSVRWDAKVGQGRIYYASTSRRLIDDVAQLLLRVGVSAQDQARRKLGYRDSWHLYIYGAENQAEVPAPRRCPRCEGGGGTRGTVSSRGLGAQYKPRHRAKEVWTQVRDTAVHQGDDAPQVRFGHGTQFCGSTMWKHSPSRSRLHRAAALLDDRDLHDARNQRCVLGHGC